MNPQSNVIELATISDNGRPPKTRLSSAKEARELVDQLIEAGRERSAFNAHLKGMFEGNPPYSTASLIKRGEGWRPNVNPMEGDAALSAAKVPYYDLFSGSMYYCESRTYYGTPDERAEWDQTITEEFDCLLRDCDGFDFNINSVIHDFVAFGKGLAMWPDNVNWRSKHIAQSRIKVRDRTLASLDELDVLVVLEDYDVTKLWGYIKDRSTAESAGWNVAVATQAIRESQPDSLSNIATDYEALQARINDHDLSGEYSKPVVRCAHVYVKEFNGKVTHLIVVRDSLKKREGAQQRFLFQKEERYEKFNRGVCTFFIETADGSWNGASGLGKAISAMIEIKTRLFCKMVENAILRASILIQPKSASTLQKNTLLLGGGVTVLPFDYEIIKAQIFADMQGVMLADRSIDDKLSNNTGIYRQKAEKPEGNPRTAKEVELAYAQQAVLGNSAVNRFYNQLDRWYFETYRRASAEQPKGDDGEAAEAARQFQRRCKERGVPIEALRKIKSVRAVRTIGNGSFVMKQQAFEKLFAISGGFPEIGRANLGRDAVVAVTGHQSSANRYFPQQAITDLPNDHEALAVLENAAMKQGSPALVTGTQSHVIHATTHIRAMDQSLEALQQGADQEDVLNFMHAVGPHIATHIQKLAVDPMRKQEVKGLQQQWQQLAGVADKLTKKVQADRKAAAENQAEAQQAAAKAAAITGGADPETVILAAKTGEELRLKGEKHALAMTIKAQAAQQKAAAAAQALAIKDATAATDIRVKAAVAATKATKKETSP